jgi:hypothetical protein
MAVTLPRVSDRWDECSWFCRSGHTPDVHRRHTGRRAINHVGSREPEIASPNMAKHSQLISIWSMLTPLFRDHPSFRLAGLRRFHTFATAPKTIPPQWDEFNQLPIPGLHDTKIFYGATCQTDLPNQRFEYMCALEVPDFSQPDPSAGRMIVPPPTTPSSRIPTASPPSTPPGSTSGSNGSRPPASSPRPLQTSSATTSASAPPPARAPSKSGSRFKAPQVSNPPYRPATTSSNK